MNELRWFVWLFPLLFIIHDMEEIVIAKHWCNKGLKQYFSLPITPLGNANSTAGFSIGVYEELILCIIACIIGNISGFYGLWYGLFIANIVHLVLFHIIVLPLAYRHYVPGEITAWLTLLPCCYILKLSQNVLNYSIAEMILWAVIGSIIAFTNLKLLHKSLHHFSRWVA